MPSCKRESSRSIRATPQRIGARRRTDNLSLQRAKPILTPSHCVSEPIPVAGYLQLGASEDGKIGPKRGGPSHPTVSVSTGSLDRSLFSDVQEWSSGAIVCTQPRSQSTCYVRLLNHSVRLVDWSLTRFVVRVRRGSLQHMPGASASVSSLMPTIIVPHRCNYTRRNMPVST